MSYCRWSTDDFRCDIYAYEGDKYYIHVAGRKHTIPWEQMKELDYDGREKFLTPIGLPHDGETFAVDTLPEFKAKLLELRKMGYRFPDRVLGRIQEEIDEEEEMAKKRRAKRLDNHPKS